MDDLIAFVTARLDEDETVARTAGRSGFPVADYDPRWRYEDVDERLSPVGAGPDTFPHIARHDPARALREVEALRSLVRLCEIDGDPAEDRSAGELASDEMWSRLILPRLAAVWDGHPDYRPEWKP